MSVLVRIEILPRINNSYIGFSRTLFPQTGQEMAKIGFTSGTLGRVGKQLAKMSL
jgi:hypothetical protein